MDSNLLKEAIADAKAVRQTALANAKVSLEEVFSERYQAMFAEKLKEDAAQGESQPAEEEGMRSAEENLSEQEIDELIKELESDVGGEQPPAEPDSDDMGAPQGEAPAPTAPPMGAPMGAPTAPPMGAPTAPPMGAPAVCPPGTIPCPGAPGGQPIPQAGDAGAPGLVGAGAPGAPGLVGAGAPGAPGLVGAGAPGAPDTSAPPPSEVPPMGDEADEDVDLNELLESLREEIGEEEEGKINDEDEEKINEDTKLASSGIGGSKAGGSANKKPASGASSSSKIESGGLAGEGFPTTDNAKVTAKEASTASRPNQAKNATKTNLSTPGMGAGNGSGGQSETGMPSATDAKVTAKEASTATRPNQAKNATKDNLSTPGGMLEENSALKKQLNEAEEVIKYVKVQLNEVNLLNAKLLYTNKLFKEFIMNNSQKMRIVEMFDLAKNVREVKLTYANFAESLNFSGSDIKKKTKINSNVQSITEGLASGAVGSTKPSREIISESKANQMISKFQRLAGIKTSKKVI